MNEFLNIDHVSMTFKTNKGPLNVLDEVDLKIKQGRIADITMHEHVAVIAFER